MGATQPNIVNSAEELFLVQGLLDELDNSALLDNSPVKPKAKKPRIGELKAPMKHNACDINVLLEGAETWNWDDMMDEVNPRKVST